MKPIKRLYELRNYPEYAQLCLVAARQLGAPTGLTAEASYRYLCNEADATDSEEGVVAEVNACIGMLKETQ